MKSRDRKARTVLVNFALVAIFSGVTILGADLMLRLFGDELLYYRPDEMFSEKWPELPEVQRYKRNVHYSGETYGDLAAMVGGEHLREKRHVVFRTDSFGFRNSGEVRNREAYDLIVLGDSFGVGTGTTQDRTWVAFLQGRYGLKTYNLSIPGSPWQSYVHLATESKRLRVHPKSIVLLAIFSGNDLDDYYYDRNVKLSDLPWNNTGGKLRVRIKTFVRRSPIRQLLRRLRHAKKSLNQVLVRDFVDGRKMLFYQPYAERKNRTEEVIRTHPNYENLLSTIRKINEIAKEHNATVVLIMVPSKEEVYEWILDGSLPWTTDTRPSGFAAAVDDFCRQSNLRFLDLKPALVEAAEKEFKASGELIYWSDDTHLNEKGHSLVADVIHRAIFTSASRSPNKRGN